MNKNPMHTTRVLVDMSCTLIHHGHIRLINEAKKLGKVIVGLTTDEEILNKKGYLPELNFSERKEILIKLCKLITRNQKELAVMESLESGKPIRDCVQIDLPETINTIKWHAELIDKIYYQTAPSGDNSLSIITN